MINLYEPNISKDDENAILDSLKNKNLSGASKNIEEFEQKFSNKYNFKFSLAVNSGTAALHLALLAVGIDENDEVIIPSLTFIATANAVSYVGAEPVVVDVNPLTYQISIEEIKKKITKKTKAIIPVHLYGNAPNLDEINIIAKENNLKVINDSAEALGTNFLNKPSGSYGDVSIYSFYPNKLITTGEGGMLVTEDEKIYNIAKNLRGEGLKENTSEYIHSAIGYNYRMNSLSASLGISQLKRVDHFLERKKEIFIQYKNNLQSENIQFIKTENNVTNSYWLTVANFENINLNVDDLREFLIKEKIETKKIFYPIDRQVMYKENNKECKNSYNIYKNSLCLPSFPDLTDEQVSYISSKIKSYISLS